MARCKRGSTGTSTRNRGGQLPEMDDGTPCPTCRIAPTLGRDSAVSPCSSQSDWKLVMQHGDSSDSTSRRVVARHHPIPKSTCHAMPAGFPCRWADVPQSEKEEHDFFRLTVDSVMDMRDVFDCSALANSVPAAIPPATPSSKPAVPRPLCFRCGSAYVLSLLLFPPLCLPAVCLPPLFLLR